MATVVSHSIAALAFGKAFAPEGMPPKFWVLTAVCAALPDADVIGFALNIRYDQMLGHRGITHSLPFAFVVSCFTASISFREESLFSRHWWLLVVYFFLITASHGLLDAMTNGGLGVAFFAPFTAERYFLPYRPVEVSPIGIGPFLSRRGVEVLVSEIKWIWIPAALVWVLSQFVVRLFRR